MRLGKLFGHFLNIFLKFIQPLTDVLQHPKKSYFSDIQNGMRLTFRCTKSVKKLEGKYYTNNLCIIDAVQICVTFHPSLQIVFKTLKLKFWG